MNLNWWSFFTIVGCALLFTCVAQAERIEYPDAWADYGYNLVQQDRSGVEVVFSLTGFTLQETEIDGEVYQNVIIPGIILPNQAGAPNLPSLARYVAVPQGASVELEIVEMRTETFTDVDIAPAFEIPRQDYNGPLKYYEDPHIYSNNAFYPAEPVLVSDVSKMRAVDVVLLGITPFQYNPVTRELIVYRDLRIEVNFIGGGAFGDNRLRNRHWEPVLRQNLLNYPSLPPVPPTPVREATDEDEDVEYLIIVPDDPVFIAWADTLKRWRNEQGILTGIATITDIGGNDDALIENYIDNAYATWSIPPVAVLLLSDMQNSGDVYGIDAAVYNNYCVSDNIYADFDGNHLPDMYVGRITAQDATDLENMIGKMLTLEREPPGYAGYYDHPCIAGGWQDDRWFILCAEILWGFHHYAQGKEPVREYAGAEEPPEFWSTNPNTYMIVDFFGPNGLGYIPETPSHLTDWGGNAERINADINDGAFLAAHRDHGEEDGWMDPHYTVPDLAGLTNDTYPYVFSVNCLTGKFNYAIPTFTEVFHRMQAGAVGVMSASEVSYSFVNDTFVWGVWDSMWPDFNPYYGYYPQAIEYQRPALGNVNAKYFLQTSGWPSNPDNKEVTYHLIHHHGDPFLTLCAEMPTEQVVMHADSVLAGSSTFTVTAAVDALIGLSVDGEYINAVEGNGTPQVIPIISLNPGQVLRVTVTLPNTYRYIADVPVVAESSPYIACTDADFDDAVTGNNNGQWDFTEIVDLTLELTNMGTQAATGVDVVINTDDPYVDILDGSEYYGDFAIGQVVSITDGFQVESHPDIPDQREVEFTVTATAGLFSWDSYFTLTANAPVLEFDSLAIDDNTGNNNGEIDPGETADFYITLINDGHTTGLDVKLNLYPQDPLLTVFGNPASYGDMLPGATALQTLEVTADQALVPGTVVDFVLEMSALPDYMTYDTIQVQVGDIMNLPTGPDTYGYYAWDDHDFGECHAYDWVDIAPAAGGSGTILPLTSSNQTTQVNLPFGFTYYGINYFQISICTNGWAALGATTSTAYANSGLPSMNGPDAMIAAFWTNLDPPQGGSEICTYHDAANHRFIIEWYNIAHYNQPDQRETFQVILLDPAQYPTSSGDGIVWVQYHTVSNTTIGTFGIKDDTETVGLQYGYNGNYDLNAWPVEAERTITYTTQSTGTQPDVTVALTALNPPIRIPVGGGSFDFTLEVTNTSSTTQGVDLWIDVTLPNGSTTAPLLGPVHLDLPQGFNTLRQRTQQVPGAAPEGIYSYNAYSGIYPNDIWDDDSFEFEKLSSGDGPYLSGWESFGDPLESWLTGIDPEPLPTEFSLGQNYPNPFNPATTISFDLPEACQVKFDIFDVKGSRVGVGLEPTRQYSPGHHSITFDGCGLPSGIYFYRLTAGDFTGVGKMLLLK